MACRLPRRSHGVTPVLPSCYLPSPRSPHSVSIASLAGPLSIPRGARGDTGSSGIARRPVRPDGEPGCEERLIPRSLPASVVDNLDPEYLGRVRVEALAVLGEGQSSWAMPCVSYLGPDLNIATTAGGHRGVGDI